MQRKSTETSLPVSYVPPRVVCEIEGHDTVPLQDLPPRVLPTVDDLPQPFIDLFKSFVRHRRARKPVCRLPRQLLTLLRLQRHFYHPKDQAKNTGVELTQYITPLFAIRTHVLDST